MEPLRRSIDVLFSLLGLLILAPVLLMLALLVAATSPGPVIYRGARTGRGGKPFFIYKFRSMTRDGERIGGTTTGQGDPRLTSVGRWMRRYKLDELPQLLNVLRGDMSLVGPRPEVPEYTDAYSAEERRILNVRPGITDLASLEFVDLQSIVGSDDPDRVYREQVLPRKNELRLRYVDTRSLCGDMAILARTIGRVAWRALCVR